MGVWAPGADASLQIQFSFASPACGEAGSLLATVQQGGFAAGQTTARELYATCTSTALAGGRRVSQIASLSSEYEAARGGSYTLWLALETADLAQCSSGLTGDYTIESRHGAGTLAPVPQGSRQPGGGAASISIMELALDADVRTAAQDMEATVLEVASDVEFNTKGRVDATAALAGVQEKLASTEAVVKRNAGGVVVLNEGLANVTATVFGMSQCHLEGKVAHPGKGCKALPLPECGPVPGVAGGHGSEDGNVVANTVVQFACNKGYGQVSGGTSIKCPRAGGDFEGTPPKCGKCKSNCDACDAKLVCAKCAAGFFLDANKACADNMGTKANPGASCADLLLSQVSQGKLATPPYQKKSLDGWCSHSGSVHQDVPGCGRVCYDASGKRGTLKAGDWPNAPCSACPAAEWANCGKSGVFWLKGSGVSGPHQGYCDMTTDGGGWEVVWKNAGGTKLPVATNANRDLRNKAQLQSDPVTPAMAMDVDSKRATHGSGMTKEWKRWAGAKNLDWLRVSTQWSLATGDVMSTRHLRMQMGPTTMDWVFNSGDRALCRKFAKPVAYFYNGVAAGESSYLIQYVLIFLMSLAIGPPHACGGPWGVRAAEQTKSN